jgi:catechol 2,3-dioxygenase-like lactoylglutathione lyase family enzyme
MPEPQPEAVPALAIGHLSLTVGDVDACHGFYADLGLRTFDKRATMAILELRGGTHLLLFQRGAPDADVESPFDNARGDSVDLMIAGRSREDLEAVRRRLVERGHAPEPIADRRFFGHYVFKAKDPDGNEVTVSTSHASDLPV